MKRYIKWLILPLRQPELYGLQRSHKSWAGGWKLEGLPWNYSMDKNLLYKLDVDKMVASD